MIARHQDNCGSENIETITLVYGNESGRAERAIKRYFSCKTKIVISLPSTKQVDKRVWQALMRTNAQITVYSDGPVPLKNVKLQRQNKAFPFIVIDDEIFWAGRPHISNDV